MGAPYVDDLYSNINFAIIMDVYGQGLSVCKGCFEKLSGGGGGGGGGVCA